MKNKRTLLGVGYLGDGKYKSKINGVKTPQYISWSNMLMRCYSEKYQKRQKTYVGCEVCDEWHNFQNYAKWYDENYPKDGGKYSIDKDIIMAGNKLYSPDYCMFVTKADNAKQAMGTYGVIWVLMSKDGEVIEVSNQIDFCRRRGLNQPSLSRLVRGLIDEYEGWVLLEKKDPYKVQV